MKALLNIFFFIFTIASLASANAASGYEIKGNAGVMHFVAVDASEANNEDVYRLAVAEVCSGRAICQVLFWTEDAPNSFPLSDKDADSKRVHWQQNLNTGLRRWLVDCDSGNLFLNERSCL